MPENLEKFCEIVGKEKEANYYYVSKPLMEMIIMIGFEELEKILGIDGKMLVRNFYR